MSKWRPTEQNCIYVIPDIHGQLNQLNLILSRILPLRKSDGGQDRLIFLGDYIDRRPESHKVLDRLIELKKKYKNQIIFLKGNHEEMFMDVLFPKKFTSDDYLFWMKYGGDQTLIGYLERAGFSSQNPFTFQKNRIIDIVPKEHVEFIKSCRSYYELENFIFVHGGCDPTQPLSGQDSESFLWDRSLFTTIQTKLKDKPLPWEKIVVTGHNSGISRPVFRDKFLMLDDSGHDNLLVIEMRSRQTFVAKHKKQRLVEFVC